jgi:hypothetical protein
MQVPVNEVLDNEFKIFAALDFNLHLQLDEVRLISMSGVQQLSSHEKRLEQTNFLFIDIFSLLSNLKANMKYN